ncbi:STAS domain-containing protein [Motiliproteus sp.]|uniref:STAS domain-containing protein n=1 Tax=Motiliproteus sp. TaxID=1898955 RepID=UPI003BADA3B3
MSVQLAQQQSGQWQVVGVVDFSTANRLRQAGIEAIEQARSQQNGQAEPQCLFDFSGVVSANTVALSLLLSWRRNGERRGVEVSFCNLPTELHAIAEFSDLQRLVNGA